MDTSAFTQAPFRHVQTPRADALRVWRTAAQLVSARWTRVLKAEPDLRRECYAAYIAALDVEAAAAAELAALSF